MIMNLHIEDKNIMYHKNKELETNLTKKLEKELSLLSSQEMWQIKTQIKHIEKYTKNRENIFLL